VSKRRSRPPRHRKDHGRESTPPAEDTTASVVPHADAVATGSQAPAPMNELDELDAGWDELLV
jgi:hypothetical protein